MFTKLQRLPMQTYGLKEWVNHGVILQEYSRLFEENMVNWTQGSLKWVVNQLFCEKITNYGS